MASFVPLNQIEDPTVSKQEHTRELQLEQAFKTFESALNLQKQNSLLQCYELYEQLFKVDVVSSHYDEEPSYIKGIQNAGSNAIVDELSFLSPNLKSLRYLIFRNRAFLYLSILQDKQVLQLIASKKLEEVFETSKELFYSALDDLGNALIYQEADELLLTTLFELLVFMRSRKLARYVLEYTLNSKEESSDILGLLLLDTEALESHKALVDIINSNHEFHSQTVEDIDRRYAYLAEMRDDFERLVSRISEPNVVKCKVSVKGSLSWESLTSSINNMVKSKEEKSRIETTARLKLKDIDPYFFTSHLIEVLRLEVPQTGDTDDIAEAEDVEPDVEPDVEEEPEDPELEDRQSAEPALEEDAGATPETQNGEPQNDEAQDNQSQHAESHSADEKRNAESQQDDQSQNDDPQNGESQNSESQNGNDSHIGNESQNGESQNGGSHNGAQNGDSASEQPGSTENRSGTPALVADDANGSTPDKSPSKQANSIQRASKRLQKIDQLDVVWLPEIELEPSMFSETSVFFEEINKLLAKLPETYKLNDIATIFVFPKQTNMYVGDFVDMMNVYLPFKHFKGIADAHKLRERRLKNTKDDENEKSKLLEVLKSISSSIKLEDTEPTSNNGEESVFKSPDFISNFINEVNSKDSHINDVKIGILKFFLGPQPDDTCLICDEALLPALMSDISAWATQLEQQIIQESNYNLMLASNIKQELTFAVSIFELFVDIYVEHKGKVDLLISQNAAKGFQKAQKAAINTQISSVTKLRSVVERWKLHVQKILHLLDNSHLQDHSSFKSYVRFVWALCYKEKYENGNFHLSKFLTKQLSDLYELIESDKSHHVHFKMPNYSCITEIHPKSIQLLSNTVTVVSVFAKVIYTKQGDDNEEAVNILERTLIDPECFGNELQSNLESQSIASVKALLEQASNVKYDLWTILILYYSSSFSLARFQFGFEKLMRSILKDLTSEAYTVSDEDSRYNTLLKCLTLFSEYLVLFMDRLSENSWKLSYQNLSSSKEAFKDLLALFELLYMFSLHEEAALFTSVRATLKDRGPFGYFKQSVVRLSTLLVIYYDLLIRDDPLTPVTCEDTFDLLSLVHDQLGNRRLCDSGDGILLEVHQDLLLQSDLVKHQNEILQVMACRQHWKISVGDFTPADHDTAKGEEINQESAYRIAKVILPLCLSRDPIVNVPRGDLKAVLDVFYDVIGDPEIEPFSTLDRNSKLFSDFLDNTPLTSTFIKNSFHGLFKLEFFEPEKNQLGEIAKNGLYYLQGLLVFSSYKVRKKSMQGRSLEVENVIKLLKQDLLFNPTRVESWYLLGQAYGFLVEDDLIWTPDKLTTIDKKILTANLQRKSLICYLVAINFSNYAPAKNVKLCVGDLMSSFSVEMLNACSIPMEMSAFKVTDKPKFVHVSDENKFVAIQEKPFTNKKLCWKIIQQCLHLAIKSNPDQWTNYYYLSKVQGKLGLPITMIIDTLIDACSRAPSHESVLEPHYRLCSVAFKAVKKNTITVTQAVELLYKNEMFALIPNPGNSEELSMHFCQFIIQCLKTIAQTDKKKWHHKYHYRLAKIYFEELHDVKAAIEEMSTIVSLKATSKTLVLIWKPDIERPGKHFCYTSQYVIFYIDLLYADKNLVGLLSMIPRLRRSSSIMVSLYATWEKLCTIICKLVRYLYGVKDNFTESFLHTPIHLFFAHVKEINEHLKGKEIPESLQPSICLLNAFNELKKLNSGFGPTSLIDDTIVAIFINVYYTVLVDSSNSQGSHDSPNGKAKRLAKKDIFPCILDILKNTKRETDALAKDKPDLLNEFARSAYDKQNRKDDKLKTPVPQEKPLDVATPTNGELSSDSPNTSAFATPLTPSKRPASTDENDEKSDKRNKTTKE